MPGLKVRLGEIVPRELLEQHREHIRDFLLQEGITPDPGDMAQTELTERQCKELLEELADGSHE